MEQKKEEMQPQTRAYTVEEIAAILHIGRSSAYTLVRKGYFKSVRIGTAIRISGSPLTSGWINWNCNAEERAMAKPWYVPLRYN